MGLARKKTWKRKGSNLSKRNYKPLITEVIDTITNEFYGEFITVKFLEENRTNGCILKPNLLKKSNSSNTKVFCLYL